VHLGNGTGGSIANAAVGGTNLVSVGSFINTLPYELIVHKSIKSAEDLRGKAIGISRIGSASDVAARVLLKAVGLEPDKDVPVIQVGGASDRRGFSHRENRWLPVAARGYQTSQGDASSRAHHHRRFSKEVSISLCVPDDHQELPGE
jgi:ABC-type nitrate/sulfonate/bicarbonate transport system substrate-binding protein